MENASKALIIAGAILLSILLISLGIMVYNNAKGTAENTGLDSEKIQTFNTKIIQYCGTSKSGTDMNSLMGQISASNGAQKKIGVTADRHYISITTTGCQGASSTTGVTVTDTSTNMTYPVFDNAHQYKATYQIDSNGYINNVTITNN